MMPEVMTTRWRVLVPWLLATGLLGAADWTQFRGPHGDGVASGARVPERLDPQSILWTRRCPGGVFLHH